MKYVGSKNRHAKQLLKIILKDRKPGQLYVEPFAGGFNLIDKVSGPRWGNDVHPYLIALIKAIQKGWIPPNNVSEELYTEIKANKHKYDPHLVGFVGFCCSYGGKWFGGYARGTSSKGLARNFAAEAGRNLLKQRPGLEGIKVSCVDYRLLDIPAQSLVYCDPPYEKTTKYSGTESFLHTEFWDWVRRLVLKEGCTVFVSEYNAPDDFKCVWERQVNNIMALNTGSKQRTEKLFVLDRGKI